MNAPEFAVENFLPISIASLIVTLGGDVRAVEEFEHRHAEYVSVQCGHAVEIPVPGHLAKAAVGLVL